MFKPINWLISLVLHAIIIGCAYLFCFPRTEEKELFIPLDVALVVEKHLAAPSVTSQPVPHIDTVQTPSIPPTVEEVTPVPDAVEQPLNSPPPNPLTKPESYSPVPQVLPEPPPDVLRPPPTPPSALREVAPPSKQDASSLPPASPSTPVADVAPSTIESAPTADATDNQDNAKIYSENAEISVYTQPRYPRHERARGIEGQVIVRVEVDRLGQVLAATIQKTSNSRGLDRSALVAAKAAVFKPSARTKRAVDLLYEFKLRK